MFISLQAPAHQRPSPPPAVSVTPGPSITPTGPIQLWQFILELLSDKTCQHFISWTGDGWEFKMTDPDEVRNSTIIQGVFEVFF